MRARRIVDGCVAAQVWIYHSKVYVLLCVDLL